MYGVMCSTFNSTKNYTWQILNSEFIIISNTVHVWTTDSIVRQWSVIKHDDETSNGWKLLTTNPNLPFPSLSNKWLLVVYALHPRCALGLFTWTCMTIVSRLNCTIHSIDWGLIQSLYVCISMTHWVWRKERRERKLMPPGGHWCQHWSCWSGGRYSWNDGDDFDFWCVTFPASKHQRLT